MRVARPPAQLRGRNLLTGQLYVALDFFSDASPAKIDRGWTRIGTTMRLALRSVTDLGTGSPPPDAPPRRLKAVASGRHARRAQ